MAQKKKAQLEETSKFELPGGAVIIGYSDGSFKFFPAPIEISAEEVATIFGGSESDEDDDDEEGTSIEDMKTALLESGVTKKDLKKMSDEEIEEAYEELDSEDSDSDEDEEDEDSDDEVSIEDMKEALIESGIAKKKVNKMSDEEIEEAYSELETEDSDEDDEDSDEDEVSIEDMKAALIESGDYTKKSLKGLSDEEIEEAYNELEGDSDDEDEDSDDEVTSESLSEMDFEELEDLCDEKDLEVDPDEFEEKDIAKLRSAIAKELNIKLPKKK